MVLLNHTEIAYLAQIQLVRLVIKLTLDNALHALKVAICIIKTVILNVQMALSWDQTMLLAMIVECIAKTALPQISASNALTI
jgi:hypothetical protein